MKTSSVKALAAIMAVAMAFLSASAGVFDDAYFWCRGALDKNGSGLFDKGDFPDALHAGDSSYYGHTAYEYSPDADASLRLKMPTEEVIEPATCRSLGIHRCLKFTQPLYDVDGEQWSKQQTLIVSPALNAEKPSDATGWAFYIRFRADGGLNLANDSDAQVIFNYFNSWGPNGGGAMLWLRGSPTNGYLSVQMGATEKPLTGMKTKDYYCLCTNKWTDVLVTKKDDKLDVYCIREGGRLYSQSFTFARSDEKFMSNCLLGCYDLYSNPAAYSTRTWMNFRGSVHDLAVWKRALSEAEAMQIILPTGTEKFRLGTHNGYSLEFAGTGSPTVDPDSTNGWSSSLATIGAGQSLSVKFGMRKEEYALNETLFFTATPDSAAGTLTVTLNGAAAGSFAVEPGKTVSCFVKKGSFLEGENVLTLSNASGGVIGVDAVSFGGSWQLLEEDGAATGGSGQAGLKDFYLNDTNLVAGLKTVLHASPRVSNTNLTLHFTMPADLVATAKRARFSICASTSTEPKWAESKPDLVFRVLVNGVERGNLVFAKKGWSSPSLTIPVETLVAGENTIRIENATPLWYDPETEPSGRYCWITIDFYRLEIMKDPDGLMLILK